MYNISLTYFFYFKNKNISYHNKYDFKEKK